jgi:hypothetical protein
MLVFAAVSAVGAICLAKSVPGQRCHRGHDCTNGLACRSTLRGLSAAGTRKPVLERPGEGGHGLASEAPAALCILRLRGGDPNRPIGGGPTDRMPEMPKISDDATADVSIPVPAHWILLRVDTFLPRASSSPMHVGGGIVMTCSTCGSGAQEKHMYAEAKQWVKEKMAEMEEDKKKVTCCLFSHMRGSVRAIARAHVRVRARPRKHSACSWFCTKAPRVFDLRFRAQAPVLHLSEVMCITVRVLHKLLRIPAQKRREMEEEDGDARDTT